MRWITNIDKRDTNKVIAELSNSNPGRVLHQGDPKATDKHDVAALRKMGMVGIWELAKSED